MTKISVVVIIYKVEKYLTQCINSILTQSYKNFELILVDDGSPDNCPKICDEYAKKDSRIKVIHQRNQGAVVARWNGILESTGEYVSLVDGDDWIDSNMYHEMIKLADGNNADIVITGYKEGTETSYTKKSNAIKSGYYRGDKLEEIYSSALYTGVFYEPGIIPAMWNKLIKRDLFFKEYFPPSPQTRMGDDAAVSYPMIARADSIVIDNELYPYWYRVVEGSMSRSFDDRYFERCLELFKSLSLNLQVNNKMKGHLKYYSLFIIKIGILQLCSRQSHLSVIKQKKILEDFYKKYINLGIDVTYSRDILEDCKWLKQFVKGDIKGMLFEINKERVLNKL